MKNVSLVKKYAQAVAQAVEDEKEFAAVGAEVRGFLRLVDAHGDLRKALTSPFINARKRSAVLDEVLSRLGTGPKASRFLKLLLEHKRLGLMADIADALPEAWSDHLGIVTYEVTSAVPLTAAQRERLARGLEVMEKKPVRLVPRIDPGIIGGLFVRKGHIVYDASVEGQLAALRERLGHE